VGNPVVGPTHRDGLSVAVVPSGLQPASAVGRVLASQLVGDDPPDYAGALAPPRFDGSADSFDWRGPRRADEDRRLL
jgi:glycine/D-amino acid oxidase-like deaminating enzyme